MPTIRNLARLAIFPLLCIGPALSAAPAHKIMLLTGQSNKYHDWTKCAPLVKGYLEQTGLFTVDMVVTPPAGADTT